MSSAFEQFPYEDPASFFYFGYFFAGRLVLFPGRADFVPFVLCRAEVRLTLTPCSGCIRRLPPPLFSFPSPIYGLSRFFFFTLSFRCMWGHARLQANIAPPLCRRWTSRSLLRYYRVSRPFWATCSAGFFFPADLASLRDLAEFRASTPFPFFPLYAFFSKGDSSFPHLEAAGFFPSSGASCVSTTFGVG